MINVSNAESKVIGRSNASRLLHMILHGLQNSSATLVVRLVI